MKRGNCAIMQQSLKWIITNQITRDVYQNLGHINIHLLLYAFTSIVTLLREAFHCLFIMYRDIFQEEFENTKGVIRSSK